MRANGTFEVNFENLDPAEVWLDRRRVLKTFGGDLQVSAAFTEAERRYGTMAGFLAHGLCVPPSVQERLRTSILVRR